MPYRRHPRPAAAVFFCAFVLIALAADLAPSGPDPSRGVVFTVTSTADAGPGSLREAILESNATPGADTIAFAIPFDGPHVIRPLSELPVLADPVTIDGFSQADARSNRLADGNDATLQIVIDGSAAGPADGLTIAAGGSRVRGLVIRGFAGSGIVLNHAPGSIVEGNLIGTTIPGDDARANGAGLTIRGTGGRTLVGGTNPSSWNVIAGNRTYGIGVASGAGHEILGNEIFINGGPDVDLGLDGPTPNDPLDADAGPNGLQNCPELTSVERIPLPTRRSGARETGLDEGLRIEGLLESRPRTVYRVELFAAPRAAEPGDPAGPWRLIGSTAVSTDASGTGSFDVEFPVSAASSVAAVRATVTDASGNTSEVSAERSVTAAVITWNDAGGGNWSDPANWTPNMVPGPADDAQITLDGTYTVTLDASAQLASLTLGAGSGTQTLSIAANHTLTLDGAGAVNANGVLSQSAGTVTGAGNLTVDGVCDWSGGTQSGTGKTTINGTLNLSGSSLKELIRALDNAGTTNYTGTGSLRLRTPGAFTNLPAGTFDCQDDTNITRFSGNPPFDNQGTFLKTGGAGETLVNGLLFTNNGTVDVQTGTLALNIGATHTGTFDFTGATLRIAGGTHDMPAGPTITGMNFIFDAGVVNMPGPYDVTGQSDVSGGTANWTGSIVSIGDLDLTAGTANLSNTEGLVTQTAFEQSGGTLTGTSDFTMSGLFTWTGGTQAGSGKTTANGGIAMSGAPLKELIRVLDSPGTTTYNGSGALRLRPPGVFNNLPGATFDCQDDTNITRFSGNPPFNNQGTFRKSGGAGETFVNGVQLVNTGAVDVQTGTLALNVGATHTGTFDFTGATLRIAGGTHDFPVGPTITGTNFVFDSGVANLPGPYNITGKSDVSGGTANWTGSIVSIGDLDLTAGTANLSNTEGLVTQTAFEQSGGTLTGTSDFTMSGLFTWTGGTQSGTGKTTADGGIAMSGAPLKELIRVLDSPGTTTYNGPGALRLRPPGVFNNLSGATFDCQDDTNITRFSGNPPFNNQGTFRKSGGAGETFVNGVQLVNTGAVDVQTGTLALNVGTTHTGTFDFTGATLRIAGGTHDMPAGPTITGTNFIFDAGVVNMPGSYDVTGTSDVSGGTANWTGSIVDIGDLDLTAGTANLSNTEGLVTQTAFEQPGGTLTGTSDFTMSGLFTWTGGIQSGTGKTTASGGIAMSGAPLKELIRVLDSPGTTTYNGSGALRLRPPGVFNNLPGATFDCQDDTNITRFSGTPPFNNQGTFRKSAGAGTTQIQGIAFDNSGTLEAQSGTVELPTSFVQSGGVTRLNGGNISSVGTGTVNFGAGVVTGAAPDMLVGRFTTNAAGTITPGLSPGCLPVEGDFTAGGGGTLDVEIGGTIPCAQHDRLDVSDSDGTSIATIAGNLNVSLVNAFNPSLGDEFTILTCLSCTGTFTGTTFPPLGPGLLWDVIYNSTSVVLKIVPDASADLAVTKTDGADPVLVGANITYTVTVTNSGPDAASNVTLTDTLPPTTSFVSAAPDQGTCNQAAGTVTCDLGSIANAASVDVVIVVTANADGVVTNNASASADEADPNAGNDSASEDTTVDPLADLSIVKSDSPDPVDTDATLTYTLDVSNAGPDAAASVTVTDTLPAGTVFVSATGTGWSCGESGGTVTCTRASLSVGAAPAITISVTAPSAAGTITNTADVSSATADTNAANDSASEDTSVVVATITADLSIAKSDSPDPVDAAATLTYTLDVTNAGPDTASSVTVTDTLPAGTVFQSASGTGWSCGESGGLVTCTRASLAVGAAPAITISVTAPDEGTTLTNAADVASAASDPDGSNNAASEDTTVTSVADLSISKLDASDPVDASTTVNYALQVINGGPSTASSLTMTDTLPAGTTFLSATGTGWSCSESAGVVTCTRASLSVGAAPGLSISMTAPAEGTTLTNTASVSAATADRVPGNDSDSEDTTVLSIADLSLAKADSPDPVDASSPLTYTLDVSNAGPSMATSLTVTDDLPAGAVFQSASGSGWSCGHASGLVTCTRTSLGIGAAPTINLVVTSPPTGGTITNTAAVSSAIIDRDGSNDSASEDTTVTSVANLSLSKAGSADPVDAGATLVYTLTVTNAGPDAASSLTVTDTLPPNVGFVSAAGAGWACSHDLGIVTCTRPSLANGAASTIDITITTPSEPGAIDNSATVTAASDDPNPANNSDTENTTVNPLADLSLAKTDGPDPVDTDGTLDYTLDVTNNGPSTAMNLTVADVLPAGVTFQSASGSGWSCGHVSGIVTCTRASLAPGPAPTITITVTAPSTQGTLTNTADVTTSTPDPNAANDSDSEDTLVQASTGSAHDLALEKITLQGLKTVKLSDNKPFRVGGIKVRFQNRSAHDEVIPSLAVLENLITVNVDSLGPCPDLVPTFVGKGERNQFEFPLEVRSKKRLNVVFTVRVDTTCVNDPEGNRKKKGDIGHEDYSVSATIDHSVIDGQPDAHPVDDVCPRTVAPPFEIDPFPDGSIKDRGCGTKRGKKQFGDPVLIDLKVR